MKVIVIILAIFVAQGYSQRHCFICQNCNDPFDTGAAQRHLCTADNIFQPPGQEPPVTPPITPPPDGPPATTEPPTLTPPTEALPPGEDPTLPPINGIPTTTTLQPTPADVPQGLYRKRRNAVAYNDPEPDPANQQFRCFIAHRDVGGNRQTERGCTVYLGDETCGFLGVTGNNCRVCDSDGCNSGSRFTLSILTLIAALFIVVRLH
ncbi:protein eyes shut-like [Phlebotomus argentipes]|uniref:protein eyes shut-like n=1 Tax=Phlebotomus argentipes TaxID=94469 RepID=UPI00289340CA|nr:protein eyes shut-like [Phlebotomus argentipes]